MDTGFDPYHRWLSIPPSEQPPNHYRLLGVAAYESNVEVIQNAAERQSRHVLSHLRSPLGAYAVNLIREIEVARLCLIDPEAKRAYDAWLELRPEHEARAVSQPSTSRHVGKPDNIHVKPNFSTLDEFPSSAAIGPSIVAHRYGRKKRKSAPIVFVLMWLASGAIGLLAGYAILCMINPKYDFLHVMFRDDLRDTMRMVEAKNRSAVKATADKQQSSRPIVTPQLRPQRTPSMIVASNNPIELDPSGIKPRLEDELLNGPNANGKGKLLATRVLKPVILPFNLKKRVLRVVSFTDELPSQRIFCNVDGSAELRLSPLIDFPLGEKRELLFNVGMNDTIVGAEISFFRRNDSIVVEIRPMYRLPSGDQEAFYRITGVKKANRLANQVSIANNAKASLPALQSQLRSVTTEYNAVLPTANTPTTTGRYLVQVVAQRRAAALFDQGVALENQIRNAESLSANLFRLQSDLSAIQELGEWGASIAKTATLSVSVHKDGLGLVAEAR